MKIDLMHCDRCGMAVGSGRAPKGGTRMQARADALAKHQATAACGCAALSRELEARGLARVSSFGQGLFPDFGSTTFATRSQLLMRAGLIAERHPTKPTAEGRLSVDVAGFQSVAKAAVIEHESWAPLWVVAVLHAQEGNPERTVRDLRRLAADVDAQRALTAVVRVARGGEMRDTVLQVLRGLR